METQPSRRDLSRGLRATISSGVVGAVAPIAALYGLAVVRWWVTGASPFDRRYDIASIRDALPGPVVGCATVCACAAWATYAPRGGFRFARTLAIVALISLGLWCVLGWGVSWGLELTPRRLKGVEHPIFYPSELFFLLGPPIVAAAVVSMVRVRGGPRPASAPEAASSTVARPAQNAS